MSKMTLPSSSFMSKGWSMKRKKKKSPVLFSGKTGVELPCRDIVEFSRYVYSATSGPDGGVALVHHKPKSKKLDEVATRDAAAPDVTTETTTTNNETTDASGDAKTEVDDSLEEAFEEVDREAEVKTVENLKDLASAAVAKKKQSACKSESDSEVFISAMEEISLTDNEEERSQRQGFTKVGVEGVVEDVRKEVESVVENIRKEVESVVDDERKEVESVVEDERKEVESIVADVSEGEDSTAQGTDGAIDTQYKAISGNMESVTAQDEERILVERNKADDKEGEGDLRDATAAQSKEHEDDGAVGGVADNNNIGDHVEIGDDEEVAGLPSYCWRKLKHSRAYGISTSLYDCNPITHITSGEPIADVFAVCARENNAIMALADGVNWGEKAALAARCAIYGCVEYLNRELFNTNDNCILENTHDVFSCLLSSIDAAQRLIIERSGFLTTLCVALVCPLQDSSKFVVCVVNVGDSYAYVYNRKLGVREITEGSHDLQSDRDLRNPGGALGPVDGHCPDLTNMTCSMTFVEPTDIVFLASDGITDNFDPVVDHIALARSDCKGKEKSKPKKEKSGSIKMKKSTSNNQLPTLNGLQRHSSSLKAMEAVVLMFEELREFPCTAQELCADLTQHVLKLTDSRRKVLEDPQIHTENLESMPKKDRKRRDRKIREKMQTMPGKLDHASVVAYEVGWHPIPNVDKHEFDNSVSRLQEKRLSLRLSNAHAYKSAL